VTGPLWRRRRFPAPEGPIRTDGGATATRSAGRGSGTALKSALAGTVLFWGCAELALESDRIPTAMTIMPTQRRFASGQTVRLQAVVKDQNDEVMRIPGWTPPEWAVASGSGAEIGSDGTLRTAGNGIVEVTARVAELTGEAGYCFSSSEFGLYTSSMYLTQAVQSGKNEARLIAGRPGLLRIFLGAYPPGDHSVEVRVSVVQGEDVVFEHVAVAEGRVLKGDVDESTLDGSLNVEIPGSALRPGAGIVLELDPNCKEALTPATATRQPETGATDLRVVEPQLFRQVFVPTLWRQQPDGRLGTWLEGIGPDSEQMHLARNLLPVWDLEVEVRDTFRTNADLRTNEGWSRWLNEISVLNISEGRRAYYYGVIGSSPGRMRGLAQVGAPWSVGVADQDTYTHEIGHNMGLRHAPCGGADSPDPDYPYDRGSIGVWGYEFENGILYDPDDYKDVMSYCDPVWISDYHFDLAIGHRLDGDGGVVPDGGDGADRGDMLVVWGLVADGELKLDPAFVAEGPAELPRTDGPYQVEGLGAGGETMFSLSFAPTPLAHGGAGFVFFVPYEPEWATALDRLVLAGPEGEDTVTRGGEPGMAVVTDPSTGLIQAIIRDWDGGPLPGEATGDVRITRGIPGGALR